MASRFSPPPIIKAAERLLKDIEQAVRTFPRYHRYQIGADLRRKMMDVYRIADRAWRDRSRQRELVDALVWAVDEVRQHLQVAKLVNATRGFKQFEHLARQVSELGKQAGGWRRSLREAPHGQNAAGRRAVPQRAEKLSTRAASAQAGAKQ